MTSLCSNFIGTICFVCRYIDDYMINFRVTISCLKGLLLRYTFNLQFTFNYIIYRKKDDATMGSPLNPKLVCFMANLKNSNNNRQLIWMTLSLVAKCVMNRTLQTFNICQSTIKFILKVKKSKNAFP